MPTFINDCIFPIEWLLFRAIKLAKGHVLIFVEYPYMHEQASLFAPKESNRSIDHILDETQVIWEVGMGWDFDFSTSSSGCLFGPVTPHDRRWYVFDPCLQQHPPILH